MVIWRSDLITRRTPQRRTVRSSGLCLRWCRLRWHLQLRGLQLRRGRLLGGGLGVLGVVRLRLLRLLLRVPPPLTRLVHHLQGTRTAGVDCNTHNRNSEVDVGGIERGSKTEFREFYFD